MYINLKRLNIVERTIDIDRAEYVLYTVRRYVHVDKIYTSIYNNNNQPLG